jgi:hypothetical protein
MEMKLVQKIERNSVVLTVPFSSETANFFKYTDNRGTFPQNYYVPKGTWPKAPESIRITIEPIG